jgi:RNA polymerase sigma factor (sigma-70 family)
MEVEPTPLARVYQEHRKQLRKRLVRKGVHAPDVDDVIQQLFSELHRDLAQQPDKPRDLVAWVYGAAHNKAVDYIRHQRRREEMLAPGDLDDLIADVASPALDATQQLLDEERRRFLRQALQRMIPERRVVLEHRIYHELTVAQSAFVLDLPEPTVCARLTAGFHDLEAAYARFRAENERREGALVLPLTLAALLGFGWSSNAEAAAGGRPAPREADSGIARKRLRRLACASLANLLASEQIASANPSSRWRDAFARMSSFVSGAVFGGAVVAAAALWLFLRYTSPIDLPLHRRADEARWILSILDPSEAPSIRVPHDVSLTAPEPPPTTSHGATGLSRVSPLSQSSVPTPSQPTRRAKGPLSERDVVRIAQSAIRDGNIDVARSILEQYAKEFPNGDLKGMRDALLAGLPR